MRWAVLLIVLCPFRIILVCAQTCVPAILKDFMRRRLADVCFFFRRPQEKAGRLKAKGKV